MDRRNFIGGIMGALASPVILREGTEPLDGVGILRYPGHSIVHEGRVREIREIAAQMAKGIKKGTILGFPNDRDSAGAYEWDFTIVAGDPQQVKIERS